MIEKIKENLNIHFRELKIDERLSQDKSLDIYENLLKTNLEDTFHQVCNSFDRNNIQAIQGINFPFRDLNFEFSIEVFNNNYQGRYSCWCPELIGCITEGNSKLEALNNLCSSIAEVLILNYDYLKINPIKQYGTTPQVTEDFFINTRDYQSYSYSKTLNVEFGFTEFYLGKRHLLLKNPNDKEKTLTLPYQGFQQLTKHLIENTASQSNTSNLERLKNMSSEEQEELIRKSLGIDKKNQDFSSLPDEELF